MTLNGVLTKILYPFADDHAQINTRGFGNLERFVATKEVHYPLMFVFLNNITHPASQISYNLTIVFADKDKVEGELFQEIVSDTASVARDLASYLRNHPSHEIDVQSNWTVIPFSDKTVDYTAGVTLDLSVLVTQGLNDCEIPLKTLL